MPDRSATKILFRWKVSLTPEGNLFARCDELELSTFAPSPKELDECIRDSMTLLFEELAESGELDSYLENRGQAQWIWTDSQVPVRTIPPAQTPVEEMPFLVQVQDVDGRTQVLSL